MLFQDDIDIEPSAFADFSGFNPSKMRMGSEKNSKSGEDRDILLSSAIS